MAQGEALAAKANWTLDDAKAAIQIGVELMKLVEELLLSGVAVGAVMEDNAMAKMAKMMMSGEGGMLPIKAVLDLTYSKMPPVGEPVEFVGGPWDGKMFKLTEKQAENRTLLLDGAKADPPQPEKDFAYVWTGWIMEFDRELVDKDELTD